MRILADENIQQRTVQYLREKGWDIVWAADEDLSGEPGTPNTVCPRPPGAATSHAHTY